MAYDQSLISRVRATYESQNLSIRDIHETFTHEIPSHKTIETWALKAKKEGNPWVKNRYSSLDVAVESIVKENMDSLNSSATEALKEQMKKSHVVPTELMEDDSYMEQLGKSKVKSALTKNDFVEMMEQNILDAQILAKNSIHINAKATFQMMLKSVVETKYGKNINLFAVNSEEVVGDLKGKSDAELLEMLKDMKE
jgi:hypothetical protein